MKKSYIIDGNEAAAKSAYMFSEVCGIYPITPATPMATLTDKWSAKNKKNLFDKNVKVVQMQSEAGAAAFCHGSLQAGSLSTTFTASQGLLLMVPSMYKMAGEMLPAVIHVAARSIATHALSIFGDHQDIYAVRQTGFCMLSSSSVKDVYYLSAVAHLSAIKGSLPFVHFFDGFRTSHELNKVNLIDEESLISLIDKEAVTNFKNRALNLGKNITRGTAQTADVYFQNTEVRNKYYDEMPDIVEKYMNEINKLAGTNYKPFQYHGSQKAKYLIIAMASVCEVIKQVIKDLGEDYGLIEVHLYRPFSAKHLLKVLPQNIEKIAVLDRTKEPGSSGEPLYLDIIETLKNKNIEIYGGRYGLSSKDVPPSHIKAVFDNLLKIKPKNHFTIGIEDDITNLSLEIKPYQIQNNFKEIKVFGFGSDGMVSASKNLLKVLGENEKTFVQGYFEYDSKKSGGVTISHLRISNEEINAPYLLTSPDFVVISKDVYLSKYNCLLGIRQNGKLLISTSLNNEELNNLISNENKKEIKEKNIKVYTCNLEEINQKYSLQGKLNNIICSYMIKLLGGSSKEIESFKEMIKKTYQNKGEIIVDRNLKAIEESTNCLLEFDTKNLTFTQEPKKELGLINEMLERKGDNLKVSDFINHKDGTYLGGSSASDKRKISSLVPNWCKENCIECNMCSFICPHAVIRPFSLTDNDLIMSKIDKSETIPSMGEENKNFFISVASSNCTGCGLCQKVCPGKNGEKALVMDKPNDRLERISEYLFNEHENQTNFNKYTIKGVGFQKPYFEFPGSCAGCGQTAYIKVLTELYGKNMVIANATGCSSIYGASLPITPYKIPWINSLFEDNAEFGYGIHESYKEQRNKIKEIMYKTKDEVDPIVKATYKEWIDNMEDDDITNAIKEKLEKMNIPNELRELIDYIPSRKVWILGGDGWAYDIGYGGLDHVLHSNENINVLVLDTEVYSNTGGQKSKSTHAAAIAEFSSLGKKENKKDLFKIASCIPNVYVASISMGANMMHTLKVFKEAYEHDGPSLIIAYSPCIEQGIYGGLQNSIEEQKLLVESGYNLLMRYLPKENKYIVDGVEPDFTKYESIFKRELRYKNLENTSEENYNELFNKNLNNAISRYNYFKNLENQEAKNE